MSVNDGTNGEVFAFDFEDLAPIELPVRVRGKRYILREASADAARKWRNTMIASTRLHDGKVVGLGNVADSEAQLLSMCLFPLEDVRTSSTEGMLKVSDKPVPLNVLLSWPNRFVKPLFNKVREISDLEEKDEPDTEESLKATIKKLQERLTNLYNKRMEGSSTGASEEADPTKSSATDIAGI